MARARTIRTIVPMDTRRTVETFSCPSAIFNIVATGYLSPEPRETSPIGVTWESQPETKVWGNLNPSGNTSGLLLSFQQDQNCSCKSLSSRFPGAVYAFNSLIFLPTAPGPKLIRASLIESPTTSIRFRSRVPIPASSARRRELSPRMNGEVPRSAYGS